MNRDRLLFVHVMKTAGSYVERYLRQHLLGPRGYETYNSWSRLGRDWNEDELEEIRLGAGPRAYVHNHVGNWSPETVARFAADGWTTFAFARHPGDQWCSQWHYARKRGWPSALNTPLDAYLARAFADEWPFRPRRHVDLPDWWQTLDYVAVFSDAAFARFLRGIGLGYSPGARVNVGANPGYDHYRRTGEVSDATHERLLASARWARYQQLLAREAQATDPPLGWSRAE